MVFFFFFFEFSEIQKIVISFFRVRLTWDFVSRRCFFDQFLNCPWPQGPPRLHPPRLNGGSGPNHSGGPLGGPLSMFLKGLMFQRSASMKPGCVKSPAVSGMGNLTLKAGALDRVGGGRRGGGCKMLGNGGINEGGRTGGRFRGNGLVWLWGALTESSNEGATGSAVV